MGSGGVMGNPSFIQITSKQFQTPITIYGHWSMKDNLEAVRTVLSRTDRIGDPSYLVAQIFYEFAITLGKYDGQLSFGIDAFGHDPEKSGDVPTVYVDADTGVYTRRGIEYDEFAPKVKSMAELVREAREGGPKITIQPKPARLS
jgi:hypothetical protein